jgi:hypothetical protein
MRRARNTQYAILVSAKLGISMINKLFVEEMYLFYRFLNIFQVKSRKIKNDYTEYNQITPIIL